MRGNKIEKNLDGYILIKIIITHFYDVLFLIINFAPSDPFYKTAIQYNTKNSIFEESCSKISNFKTIEHKSISFSTEFVHLKPK